MLTFISRRNFLKWSLVTLGGGSVAGYTRFIEPKWLEITEKQVHFPNHQLITPIRLLHISDLQASKWLPFAYLDKAMHLSLSTSLSHLEHAINLSLSTLPDLICITGDFISTTVPDFKRYRTILKKLSTFAPTFACLGNHDGGNWAEKHGGYPETTVMFNLLRNCGIICLQNAVQAVTVKKQAFYFVGLGDLWTDYFQPQIAFPQLPKTLDKPVIVLSHNPDSKDFLKQYPWDLMLCGHTHGGQFVVPFLGTTPFAPVRDHRFVAGLHTWEGHQIHTTRGIGNVGGIRLNCRPEISILELI